MIPNNIKVKNLRTFLPSKDYDLSRRFYQKLGFTETWYSPKMSVYKLGEFSFYLQKFYVEDWANNFMMFVEVENCDDWWIYMEDLNLKEEFPTVKSIPPKSEEWGRECMLIDPTGILWHFGEYY